MLNYSANGPSGYNLTRSVRLRRSASAYLNRTPGVAGNQKTYTFSFWYKRGLLTSQQGLLEGYVNSGTLTSFNINNDTFNFQIYNSPSYNVVWATTAVFRDPSSWYHVVLTIDTTQASQANMAKLYINGVQQTFTYTNYIGSIAQNTNTNINASGTGQYIGVYNYNGSYQDGYFAETYLIDGQALTPSSFGQTSSTTGVWIPKQYSGTYGTNGFYLPFTDNSSTTSGSNVGLGKDFSGNGNFWNTNNISVTAGTTYDSMTDVPTLTSTTAANYAVLNPLGGQGGTWSNGNLKYIGNTNWRTTLSTIEVPTTGKWYAEATLTGNAANNTQAGNYAGFGITPTSRNLSLNMFDGNALAVSDTGFIYNFVAYPSGTNLGSAFASGDVIGLAVDTGANTYTFYKNNVSVASGTIGITAGTQLSFGYSSYDGNYGQMSVNFGQQGFKYTPPTGYLGLNTYNLLTPTIVQGNKYMDATLWTGNGSAQTITNAGAFKPDLVWWKNRNSTRNNLVFDSIRGVGNYIQTNTTAAEATDAQMLTSFNSDGFTHGTSANGATNAETYVGWQWQAGQGTTSSNTDGSIASTTSVNATAGFSIVTYTNASSGTATVGHGLGVAPAMIITKQRGSVGNWRVYHKSLSAGYYLLLNSTAAQANTLNIFTTTLPTSTVFSLGTTVAGEGTAVAYCWAEIAGFSKFGSYVGNNSTDGTFVYLGFRPKYVLVKNISVGVTNWGLYDSSRNTYNVEDALLKPNLSNAEVTYGGMDFLSNGFKLRNTDNSLNDTNTYIYAAFAENPFKNALAR